MHRTLQRPMFRIGGSAGDGITSGLRQGYANGREVDTLRQRMDIVNQLAPRSDEGVSDFLMEWGLNMMGNPPSGNIFQTAAKQAQVPFKTLQAGRAGERSGQRELATELVKGLSDEDLSTIEEKIRLRMRTNEEDYLTASRHVWDTIEYSKTGHVRPEIRKEDRINEIQGWLMEGTTPAPIGGVKSIAEHFYDMETGAYDDTYGEEITQDFDKAKGYFRDIHIQSTRDIDEATGQVKRYLLSPEGVDIFGDGTKGRNKYEGKIFFDYRTGNLYRKQGTTFVLVEATD
jgi:hypothetical protein